MFTRHLSVCHLLATVFFLSILSTSANAATMSFGDLASFGTSSARHAPKAGKKSLKKKKYSKARKKKTASSQGSFSSYFWGKPAQSGKKTRVRKKRRIRQARKTRSVRRTARTARRRTLRSGRTRQARRRNGRSGRRGSLMATLKSVKPSGLPLSLAAAVVTVESGWKTNARGSSGEKGLMQLMPGTARQLGVRGNLFNPATNMRAGTRYLNYCYRRAKGNIAGTIGCYNLGPGKMWAWSKNRITRNYVSKVRRMMGRRRSSYAIGAHPDRASSGNVLEIIKKVMGVTGE